MYVIKVIIMQTLINITEARAKLPQITKQKQPTILLKNGKPVSVILCYEDWITKYAQQNEHENSMHNDKAELLQAVQKIQKLAQRGKYAQQWLAKRGLREETYTDEELLDMLYEEDM